MIKTMLVGLNRYVESMQMCGGAQEGVTEFPYCNSLLSNDPVGLWHVTVGHPMNPIMTMGNLICTGVDVSFPDDTLSLGDFPTTVKAVVKLKPAMPRDRAGIEMMFNHGKKRIYMPAVVKVVKDQQLTDTRRGLWDKYVVDNYSGCS